MNLLNPEPYTYQLEKISWRELYPHGNKLSSTNLLLENSEGEIAFTLRIDPNAHLITEASFNGAQMPEEFAKTAFKLCEILAGLPIIEAQNHAVLKLEESLRDSWYIRPVPGVVQTANMPPVFGFFQRLLDRTLQNYRIQTDYKKETNTFSPSTDPSWRSQCSERKLASISAVIHTFLEEQKIISNIDLSLIGDSRIEIDLPNVSADQLPALLFALELHLYSIFGFSIEVMYHNMQDRNKKRI